MIRSNCVGLAAINIDNLLGFVNEHKVLAKTWKIHTTSSVAQRESFPPMLHP